jgi:hypothetical protein
MQVQSTTRSPFRDAVTPVLQHHPIPTIPPPPASSLSMYPGLFNSSYVPGQREFMLMHDAEQGLGPSLIGVMAAILLEACSPAFAWRAPVFNQRFFRAFSCRRCRKSLRSVLSVSHQPE